MTRTRRAHSVVGLGTWGLFLLLAARSAPLRAATGCPDACRAVAATCGAQCDSRACVRACRDRAGCGPHRARIRTLAYVVTECRGTATALLGSRQSLRIRRGDCAPVTVVDFTANAGPDLQG